MTTVTMRVPESIAERLSSAEMRSWFVDLLRRPHPPASIPAQASSGHRCNGGARSNQRRHCKLKYDSRLENEAP